MKKNKPVTQARPQDENIFERVCRLRHSGISVMRTAAAAGCSHTTVRRWETSDEWKELWEETTRKIAADKSEGDSKSDDNMLAATAVLLKSFDLRELQEFFLLIHDDSENIDPEFADTVENACGSLEISQLELLDWIRRRSNV